MTATSEKTLDVAARAFKAIERQRLRAAILLVEIDHFGVMLRQKIGDQAIDWLLTSFRADLEAAQDGTKDVVTCFVCKKRTQVRMPLNSSPVQCPKCKTRLQ